MNIKYKILSVDDAEQSIVVRFYTDKITEEDLANVKDARGNIVRCRTDVSITFYDPANRPTGDALDEYILSFAPLSFLDLHEGQKAPMDDLHAMIGVERERVADKIEGQFILREKAVIDDKGTR